MDAGGMLGAAAEAMTGGDIARAVELLHQCLALEDLPTAHQLLGALAYAADRLEAAGAAFEAAFRGFRAAGQSRPAARVASVLGELNFGSLGLESAGRGWLERARRLLEDEGDCVEWGYFELARMACHRLDV